MFEQKREVEGRSLYDEEYVRNLECWVKTGAVKVKLKEYKCIKADQMFSMDFAENNK